MLFVLFATLGSSSPAAAWTRTVVKSADATVEVDEDVWMSVLLKLDVEVQAGWLHELEFAGLGSDVEIDRRRPPYLRSDEGEIYRPEFEITEDGLIRLSFERRDAPRKGAYRVLLRYRTQGEARLLDGAEDDRARLAWTLPAWETGLHDVSVEIRAPRGASVPRELQDMGPGVDFDITKRLASTQIEWRRIHLPRHTPWTLAFDVPASAITLPPVAPEQPAPSGFRPLDAEEQPSLPWALALLACLVLLKRRSIEARVGPNALLVRTSWPVVLAAVSALVGLGVWLAPHDIVCAIPLLVFALHRPTRAEPFMLDRPWQAATPTVERFRKPVPTELLDGTTLIGLAVLATSCTVLALLDQALVSLFLLPVFFTGTRQHTPPRANESSEKLRGFVSQLRLPPEAPAIGLRWETCKGSAPRCSLVLPTERAGLLSLGFVVTTTTVGFVVRRSVMLLVETRTQSDADDLARRRISGFEAIRGEDGRIARLMEWGPDAMTLIRAFGCQASTRPPRVSKGTWLIREIAGSRREAA